jgi:enediyne biosynthesis protein E4
MDALFPFGQEDTPSQIFKEIDLGVTVPKSEIIGITAADLDNDGQIDLIGTGTHVSVLKNEGRLSFSDFGDISGLSQKIATPTQTGAAGDLDGDGDVDVLLAGQGFVRLFWNNGNGIFSDGPSWTNLIGTCASILLMDGDYDGLTDIFVIMQAEVDPDMRQDVYFRNKGDGTFQDWKPTMDLPSHGIGWVAASLDVDLDNRIDVYVANDSLIVDTGERPLPEEQTAVTRPGTRDMIFQNGGLNDSGLMAFSDVGPASNVSDMPRSTMGVLVADFDMDGLEDLYLSDYGKNDLFIAQGDGSYEEKTDAFGLGAAYLLTDDCPSAPVWSYSPCWLVSWGSAFTDFDLDGWPDLVVLNTQLFQEQPTLYWKGTGPGEYELMENELGASQAIGMYAGDLNDDGAQEMIWADGSMRAFETRAPSDCDWVRIELEGHFSNPEGLGALLTANLDDGRSMLRRIGTGGVLHSWPLPEAHFSWCDTALSKMTIQWPSGYVQEIDSLPLNKRHIISEPIQVELSTRVAAADGESLVTVRVTPPPLMGVALGASQNIELSASAGQWENDLTDDGTGVYERQLRAPNSPADALISVSLNGQVLMIQPRIHFQ